MLPGSPWARELTGGRQGARAWVSSPTQNARPRRSPHPEGQAQRSGHGAQGAAAQGPSAPGRLHRGSCGRAARLGPLLTTQRQS